MKAKNLFFPAVLVLLAACGGGETRNVFNPPPVAAQAPVQGSILWAVCPNPTQGQFLPGLSFWVLSEQGECPSGASTTTRGGALLTSNGKLVNFRFRAITQVALTATVYVNGGATALQCTIAAGSNFCAGPATSVMVFDADEVAIGVMPAGAGTFSNIRVAVEKQ